MLKINLILLFICAQIFIINCYSINHLQGHLGSDYDLEPKDEFLAKLLHMDNLFREENPSIVTLDRTDDHPRNLQKRGRQCLWKVCSWALDKRSVPSKVLY